MKLSTQIIGGADGPTSIFVSSPVNWKLIIGCSIVLIIGIILFCIHKKKKNK